MDLTSQLPKGSKSSDEEMKTGEGNHVDGKFPEISVELAGESEACGHPGHGSGDEMVEISVCGRGQFESSEADIVESLVVYAECFVCILHQLKNII